MIAYGRQDVSQEDIDAVVSVLSSDWLTQGPVVPKFEDAVSSYCGSDFAIAVNSATSALHLACMALNVKEGDYVWTSPNSFVASANCALYCKASIDFVDIDRDTYNMSVESLSEKLEEAERTGTLPKVVIPVHFAGQSCDMRPIFELSKKYGFKIIEDASHAIGGLYSNHRIGNCEHSEVTIFSFHPVKIITTGEGGMATTNSHELAIKMRELRSHGISSDKSKMEFRNDSEIWNYQQLDLGFNYRMNDIQAALGLSQMKRLNEFLKIRRSIALEYNSHLAQLPIKLPYQAPNTVSSFHLYPIRIPKEQSTKSQRQVYDEMLQLGIQVNLHYIPIYRQPHYERLGFLAGHCREAEHYFSETLSLPIHTKLSQENFDFVVDSLNRIFNV